MKLSISRAQHARLVAGLSPIERARLDELVDVHDGEPPMLIDGARIAGRFAELVAEQTRPPRRPAILGGRPSFLAADELRYPARQGGKMDALRRAAAAAAEAGEEVAVVSGRHQQLLPPWKLVPTTGPGQFWTAPAGTSEPTPPPRPIGWPKDGKVSQEAMQWLYDHGPGQPPPSWMDVDDLIDQEPAGDSTFRRHRLNQWVSEEPSDSDRFPFSRKARDLPRRELRAGQRAFDALRCVASDRRVPIVLDPDLPVGAWQIVNESGQVLFEGAIAPGPRELAETIQLQTRPPNPYVRVVHEAADAQLRDYLDAVGAYNEELADRAGIPRDVLY